MRTQFSGFPLWDTWLHGFTGQFGWLDFGFPEAVYWIALAVFVTVLAAAIGELLRRRGAVRTRMAELVTYAAVFAGLLIEIGVESYHAWVQTEQQFEQARYLLPALALYAALIALAVRLPGRRWGPVVGVALVTLALAHDLYAQTITIARFYA
jgi:surface polysaccharide O-acyltransferase-like enzyme